MSFDTAPAEPAIVTLTKRLEGLTPLDGVARLVQPLVDRLLADPRRADALHGMWVGHAIHPLLTDVPIGAWTSATMLDLLGGRGSRKAAQRLVGLGVLAAGPTAVTGWAEWGPLEPRDQRVGLVHAVSNISAVVLSAKSWQARRKGSHGRGALLSLGAVSAAGLGGYLGGHLTEARKVSSVHPAYDETPATVG